MAENYKEYLAAKVLTDGRPVTYRLLSRALKANVNVAKSMLYDFYTKQNAKKPKSIHATYILVGRKREAEDANGVNGSRKDGEDSFMHSSPFMSSLPEPEAEPVNEEAVSKTTMLLVREEELEATKAEFEEITSIHIYSLEPGPIEDMNVLSVCNHEIATQYSSEDPLERWRLYGSIHNPYIKRRTAKFAPPPAAAAPASKAATKPAAIAEKQKAGLDRADDASDANTSGQSTPQPSSASNTLKKSNSKPNLKRDKSDIFKSFAKAKPKAKEAGKSKESTPAPVADDPMLGMSEDEDEDDTPVVQPDKEQQEAARKARQERQDKLRKMMDEPEDEDMPDVPREEEQDSQDAVIEEPIVPKAAESEPIVTSQGGRRRGRRKVLKKKTVKDEEGYLVTKEEMVEESFSEDEPEPKKPKPAPKPVPAKGKTTGKKPQGSIASFFKKA